MAAPEYVGFFQGIAHDLSGKGQLRLVLQPAVAILLGIRLGLADAHEHREVFLARVFESRHGIIKRAFADVVVPFCIALGVDMILQHYTLGYVRPLAAVLVAVLLVWIPFAASRGFVNRFARAHARTA
jgi:hypothetical protein